MKIRGDMIKTLADVFLETMMISELKKKKNKSDRKKRKIHYSSYPSI